MARVGEWAAGRGVGVSALSRKRCARRRVTKAEHMHRAGKSEYEWWEPQGWMRAMKRPLQSVEAFMERETVKRIRISLFLARLPTVLAIILSQLAALASTTSWAALLGTVVGGTCVVKAFTANAAYLIPRFVAALGVVTLAWFTNRLVSAVTHRLDQRRHVSAQAANVAIALSEGLTTVGALIWVLSAFGLQPTSLVIPLGALGALASRDLLANMCGGIFLLLARPFSLGDAVALPSSNGDWFGRVASTDLWYTVLEGERGSRSVVPNMLFLQMSFRIVRRTSHLPRSETSEGTDKLP